MKTVPSNVQAVARDELAGLGELPAELRVTLGDIAGVAREGLLALSVATGMSVMQAMFEAEVTAVSGPKGRHDPERTAVRHGTEKGSVTLGGRRVPVTRPRARTVNGHEVQLQTYAQFAADDLLQRCWSGCSPASRPAGTPGSPSRSDRRWSRRRARLAGRRCRGSS